MSDKPDLVLTGKFIEKDGSFIFSEGSYRYLVVPDTYKYMLKVQHNGKPSCNNLKKQKNSAMSVPTL